MTETGDESDEAALRSFTSWKLRVLDALSMDRRVSHGEFRTAFRLLQHMNAGTGRIFPAQERIADQIGVRARQVRDYVHGLVEKGWLKARRPNRQLTNEYEFDLKHENAVLDRQIMLADERAERRKITARKSLTGEKLPVLKGEKPPLARGEKLPLNNLKRTPEGEHLNLSMGMEKELIPPELVEPDFDHLEDGYGAA